MPSPFSLGAQNADALFDAFGLGKVVIANAAYTSTQATVAVAHGLGAAPTFVLAASGHGATGEAAPTWSANATTLTFTRAATVTVGNISYIAGII